MEADLVASTLQHSEEAAAAAEEEEEEEEEAEEALSLCDLPISAGDTAGKSFSPCGRRSSSEPPELFEFFTNFSHEMSPADEIIFCGKLVPFKDRESSQGTPFSESLFAEEDRERPRSSSALRRRSESLSELPTSRSNSSKSRLVRNSRSLDYRKLYGSSSSPGARMDRNSSEKRSARKAPKSRWCMLMMFGVVKWPAEMELRDMKSRQSRRNPARLLPPAMEVSVPVKGGGRSSSKGSWGVFLRALGCKDASVAVTASLHCIPRHVLSTSHEEQGHIGH